jgi:RNA polymerase sigma factor (sigma-70 family)
MYQNDNRDPRGVNVRSLTGRAGPSGREHLMDESSSVPDLVAAARDGDQNAWNAIVDRFLPLVTGVVARHRLFGADAEDVNQTVWLKLVEHLGRLREPEALAGWIATTTRHECLALLRRRSRCSPVDPGSYGVFDRDPEQCHLGDDLLREERHQALRDGLRELPEDRRRLLLMLISDPPPSYNEISRTLGIPVGSIGPTRARALDHLRSTGAIQALLAVHGAA